MSRLLWSEWEDFLTPKAHKYLVVITRHVCDPDEHNWIDTPWETYEWCWSDCTDTYTRHYLN